MSTKGVLIPVLSGLKPPPFYLQESWCELPGPTLYYWEEMTFPELRVGQLIGCLPYVHET